MFGAEVEKAKLVMDMERMQNSIEVEKCSRVSRILKADGYL
jgi:hypothetical protein